MNLGNCYEGIERSEISIERSESRMERSEMKEINYTCTHLDLNKSYGCGKCDAERQEMEKNTNNTINNKMMGTISAAAKMMRKG